MLRFVIVTRTEAEREKAIADVPRVITTIRTALKKRSGKTWSVTQDKYHNITIKSPPSRLLPSGYMTPEERQELGKLLSYRGPVNSEGVRFPPDREEHEEYMNRARQRGWRA
jgi:hypothetical protein